MITTTEEIEGSLMGAALTADFEASPYSLTGLSSFISDVKHIVSLHQDHPTLNKITWVMCVNSLTQILTTVNKHLPIYIEDLKKGKSIEVFEISSGEYRSEDFWALFDRMCNELKDHPISQRLRECGKRMQGLLKEAEITLNKSDADIFERFFFYKKEKYSEVTVMRKFNLLLNNAPSMEKLKELRALAVAETLQKGVLDFAQTPSQREMKRVKLDAITSLLPYDFEMTEDFKVALAKFYRIAKMEGNKLNINYKQYGKYILTHFYKFNKEQLYAIFELDMMLFLIHREMERIEPLLAEKPLDAPTEQAEELFHFVHPELEDQEAWRIHQAIKRVLRLQGLQTICQYLKQLATEKRVLLPVNPSSAYTEFVRLGMPCGEGFNETTFRKYYNK